MIKLRLLLSSIILLGVVGVVYSRHQSVEATTMDNHCVAKVTPITTNEKSSEVLEMKCFKSSARALEYATDGAVNLPDDASNREVLDAFEAYNDNLFNSDTTTQP